MRLSGLGLGAALSAIALFCAVRWRLILLYQQNHDLAGDQRIIDPEKFRRAVRDHLGYDDYPGRDQWQTVEAQAPEQIEPDPQEPAADRQNPPTWRSYLTQAPEVKPGAPWCCSPD